MPKSLRQQFNKRERRLFRLSMSSCFFPLFLSKPRSPNRNHNERKLRVFANAINSSYHLFSAVSNAMSVFHRHAILRNAALALLQVAPNVLV